MTTTSANLIPLPPLISRRGLLPRTLVFSSVGEPAFMSPADDDPHNTGGGTVCRGRGLPVGTITLAEVLTRAGGFVRLFNLDCEGAEYAIPDGVDLSRVKQICGEAHDVELHGRRYGINDVIATLPAHATIDQFKNGPTTWLFFTSQAAG